MGTFYAETAKNGKKNRPQPRSSRTALRKFHQEAVEIIVLKLARGAFMLLRLFIKHGRQI